MQTGLEDTEVEQAKMSKESTFPVAGEFTERIETVVGTLVKLILHNTGPLRSALTIFSLCTVALPRPANLFDGMGY